MRGEGIEPYIASGGSAASADGRPVGACAGASRAGRVSRRWGPDEDPLAELVCQAPTVGTAFGRVHEVMGFRLICVGIEAVQGEWALVCMAWNLRMHVAVAAEACVHREYPAHATELGLDVGVANFVRHSKDLPWIIHRLVFYSKESLSLTLAESRILQTPRKSKARNVATAEVSGLSSHGLLIFNAGTLIVGDRHFGPAVSCACPWLPRVFRRGRNQTTCPGVHPRCRNYSRNTDGATGR